MKNQRQSAGLLIAVVGPSGAGKDTLINALRQNENISPKMLFVKRAITRTSAKDAENFTSMNEATFAQVEKDGGFCATWQAHGLSYGVPQDTFLHVNAGGIALLNGARRALPVLNQTFPNMKVVHITADPDILAMRLMERGRENAASISERLKQPCAQIEANFDAITIDNSGPLDFAVNELSTAVMNLNCTLSKSGKTT